MNNGFVLVELGHLSENLLADLRIRIESLRHAIESSGGLSCQIQPGDPLPPNAREDEYAILCGKCSEAELLLRVEQLLESRVWPIVAIDAFEDPGSLAAAFSKLEMDLVQLSKTAAIAVLLKNGRSFIYPYPKSDCTASICLLFDGGQNTLVIERLHYPFAGSNAFPGGFLRVHIETMEYCAYRELEEECSLVMKPGELLLVDLRSDPHRDPRAHIVDAGYAALIDEQRKAELMEQLKAGDDAGKAHILPVKDLLKEGALAFDHREFLINCLNYFKIPLPL
ncbi:MAG: NUDIX domain-containing protein [Candidatus Obscuribacterales bacterium]|nr:NUDIX domain-containing protein [Candidatus Obscuribacterales bacterium]